MSTDNVMRPVVLPSQRDAKSVEKARDTLTAMAKLYRASSVTVPKEVTKSSRSTNKSVDKITYNVSPIKRSNIRAKLHEMKETLDIHRSSSTPESRKIVSDNSDPYSKKQYFSIINCFGSITTIADYLSQRLAASTTYFDTDATLFSLASFLKLSAEDFEGTISLANVDDPGNMKVLRGFEMFAAASTVEQEYDAITHLYNEFVIGIIDVGAREFGRHILNAGQAGQVSIAMYNSSNRRLAIRNTLGAYIDQIAAEMRSLIGKHDYYTNGTAILAVGPGAVSVAKEQNKDAAAKYGPEHDADLFLVRQIMQAGYQISKYEGTKLELIPFVTVSRASWLIEKGDDKMKTNENHMPFDDIAPYAIGLGVLSEVVVMLPTKFREEEKTYTKDAKGNDVEHKRTLYPKLNLNPAYAHKLMYAFNIKPVERHVDITSGHATDINGRVRKVLTTRQALEGLVKKFMTYFDADKSSGEVNVASLIKREKFISVNGADFKMVSGFHITSYAKSSTALLFPDAIPPNIMGPDGRITISKAEFGARPDLVFELILYSIGFPANKANVDIEQIRSAVKDLYTIFGEVLKYPEGIPTTFNINISPIDRINGGNSLLNSYASQAIIRPVTGTYNMATNFKVPDTAFGQRTGGPMQFSAPQQQYGVPQQQYGAPQQQYAPAPQAEF